MNFNRVKFLIHVAPPSVLSFSFSFSFPLIFFLTSLQAEVANLPLWEGRESGVQSCVINPPHMDPDLSRKMYQSQTLDS
jgi:hypothetical protein